MKNRVGSIAMLHIDGKVAEKDKNGRLTGRMILLKAGEIGMVVKEQGKFWKDKAYTIKLAEGFVVLRNNAVTFPDEDDVCVSESVFKKASPEYQIRDSDRDTGAEY